MPEVRNLYIWGEPEMSKIRDAKQALGVLYLVVPKDGDEAGVFDRTLAWGDKPRRLCDYALVGPKTPPDGLVAALRWVLEGADDPRATTLTNWLQEILDPEAKELDAVDMEDYDKEQNLKKASVRFKLDESGDSRDR
jgi:hypothetical protein